MPDSLLIRTFLLPELSLVRIRRLPQEQGIEVIAEKIGREEYCPRCATVSRSTYDHHVVRVKDEPMRNYQIQLLIKKRRLWCAPCRKPSRSRSPACESMLDTPNASVAQSSLRASSTAISGACAATF